MIRRVALALPTISPLGGGVAEAARLHVKALSSAGFEQISVHTLDDRLKRARLHIDELSLLTASGERIAQRMEGAAASPRVAREIPDMPLPSTSILSRLANRAESAVQ